MVAVPSVYWTINLLSVSIALSKVSAVTTFISPSGVSVFKLVLPVASSYSGSMPADLSFYVV